MPNRLAQETSPYLLQHADNPVDWHPWGEAALALAREQNKPILLSIGYSTCHWCHVMARESFADEATAQQMNADFINIKVDREERPDLDQIYQIAHQLITGRAGGWPLTVFLTPEAVPFLSGTYFPNSQRFGLPSFKDLLQYVREVWLSQQTEIQAQAQKVLAAIKSSVLPAPDGEVRYSEGPVEEACRALDARFDSRSGGFGAAPKFPYPKDLEFLLRVHARTQSPRPKLMVLTTLTRMAEGGIFDQLAGGFYRYSVDAEWMIPHFEKMLSDNGPLLGLYADAYTLTGDALFERSAEGITAWVLGEMQSPQGGFYTAQDADSQGEEGGFYLWTPAQVAELLSPQEYAIASRYFGLNRGANYEASRWHLHVASPLWQVARDTGVSVETAHTLLETARTKLRAHRDARPRPFLDDKILVSGNALMIEGLARASAVFGKPEWLAGARRALDFISDRMWQGGRLFAVARGEAVRCRGMLDDYVFLLSALLELMRVDFRPADLRFARALADTILEHFEDADAGGFFFAPHDHETLIHRHKPGLDHAVPAANGVAARCLARLSQLTGNARYADASERTLAVFYPALAQTPSGYSTLLTALMEHLAPPRLVLLRGGASEAVQWCATLNRAFAPDLLPLALGTHSGNLPQMLDKPTSPAPLAWVCEPGHCLPPIDNLPELLGYLGLSVLLDRPAAALQ